MNRAVTAVLVGSCLVAVALACTRVPVESDKPAPSSTGGAVVLAPSGSAVVITHGPITSAPHPIPLPAAMSAVPMGSGAAPAGSAGALPTDMTWTAPPSFATVPNASTMRKATYKITKVAPDADDAEMSVLAASGGVAANVQRWEGQFGGAKAKTSERTVGGLKVTTVEIHGTYAGSGMPGAPSSGPKEKQVLLAAIVETEPEHFFKLVGGEKTVEKARPDFEKLVASFRAK